MATTRVLLVRHGESEVTVDGVLGGTGTCRGLTDLGRRQSVALRDRLRNGHEPAVDEIWSSTLPRALETAEVVNEAFGLDIHTDADLEEMRPGEADGVRFDDFRDRFGPVETERYPHRPIAPGAESRAGFIHRASAALHRVVEANEGRTVAVFCHGGVIDVGFRSFLDLPRSGAFDLWTLNTSLTELHRDLDGDGRPGRWRLVRYNDHAHLVGLPHETPRRE